MRLSRALRWSTGSRGTDALGVGVLALLAAAAVAFCGLTLDNAVYQPIRELPGKWVGGYFITEPFWITRRASGYVIDLELPDTRVSTLDHTVDTAGRHFIQRCGQPFPGGVTWSVRHSGHLIAQHTSASGPWCEDASVEHTLRAGIGTFRASPGDAYSIRIDALKLPLRLSLRAEGGQTSGFGLPAVVILYFLVWLGVACLFLGAAVMLMERFQIVDRLEEHLRRKRDEDGGTRASGRL